MPRTRFSGALSSPKVDLIVDMGNPFLNLAVDGFLKIGTVAAAKVAAEEAYYVVKRGSVSHHNFENSVVASPKSVASMIYARLSFYHNATIDKTWAVKLKKMCKEGAYWGTVAGVYAGMEYGVERIRGIRDWKNAMVGGALTGALVSAASNNSRDKIVMDAIAGGAVATAAEFLNYLT